MEIVDVVQGSPEWFKAKIGIPSASNFRKIVTAEGKVSKQRTKYLYQLAGETLTGISEESYKNEIMLRGQVMEAETRQMYQLVTGAEVQEVGFCLLNGCGCSPDGLVGSDGLIEIKCPLMATQVDYLLENMLPTDYFQQVQGQLLVTDRKWVDFVSYFPGLKPLIVRVERDEKFLKALKAELKSFCKELKEVIKKIR